MASILILEKRIHSNTLTYVSNNFHILYFKYLKSIFAINKKENLSKMTKRLKSPNGAIRS